MRYVLFVAINLVLLVLTSHTSTPASEKPGKSVKEFLEWYSNNHKKLNTIDLVLNYSKQSGAKGGVYDIDFKAVEKYLTELKKSTCIGPKFIETMREKFKQFEADFKSSGQKQGTPKGFENDFIMLTADVDGSLKNLDKMEIVSETVSSNNLATVKVKFADGKVLLYELAKQNNKWLINVILG